MTAEGLALRDLDLGDLEAALRLSRASGWNQAEEDWQLLLSEGRGLFRVVVEEGHIVASGGAVRYGSSLAWICMILVEPACRGRGLGTLIFEDVLARVDALCAAGELKVIGLDATPGGRGIYLRHGFRDGPPLLRLGVQPGGAAPPPASAGAPRSLETADLDAVLALDREVFGADRGPVLRWACASAPEYAWLVGARGSRPEAYCFGRRGDHSDHVGAVAAPGPGVARELVAACLRQRATRPVILDVPARPDWLAALGEMGFAEQRPFTRMYRGAVEAPGRLDTTFAVFGPEFG